MNWFVTLDGEIVVDAVNENPTMSLDDALDMQHDLKICHPNSEVTLWKGIEL